MSDSIHEACGIFGIYNSHEAAELTYLGLYALQHRGQESSGMVVGDGERWQLIRRMFINHYSKQL